MARWYKLDNAAKLFASVSNTKNTSVFRVSAILKEKVDFYTLQKATDTIFHRFPMLTVKMRRGVFWNYLDANTDKCFVAKEEEYPCNEINAKERNGYLFKVLYYKNRVSVEVFHTITDGGGAIEFLKSLLYYYFLYLGKEIPHEGKVLLATENVKSYELEDSFKVCNKKGEYKEPKKEKAYRIKGASFENFGNNVVFGVMNSSELNAIAKKHNVTITVYLTALYIYSIYQARIRYDHSKLPIVVTIPVNLRKAFNSRTLRNFAAVVNVGARVTNETTFEELLTLVKDQIAQKTTMDKLQNMIYHNVKLESNKATRIAPLFIKSLSVFAAFNISETQKTTTLSNVGNIPIPTRMNDYIHHFEAVVYPTKRCPLKCAVCSVNDKLTISFSRTIVESDVLQYFFSSLANTGLEIQVYSNEWGEQDEQMQ